MKTVIQKKSGVALLWVIILSSILIIISSTMVSYIAKELRSSARVTSSATSYSYAKSGIAWAKNHISNLAPGDIPNYGTRSYAFDFNKNNLEETSVTITRRALENDFIIKSTSENNNVVRAIEYTIKESGKNFILPDQLNNINYNPPQSPRLKEDNNGSFEMSFVFWARDNLSQRLFIGASQTSGLWTGAQTGSSIISVSLQDTTQGTIMAIAARDTGGATVSRQEQAPLKWEAERASRDVTSFIGYRGFLTYIEDTSASFRIERIDGTCIGTVNISLVGRDFGNLRYLFINSGVGTAPGYRYIGITGPVGPFGHNYLEALGPNPNGVHIRNIAID